MLRIDQKRRGLGAHFTARLDGRVVASWRTGVNWTGGAPRPLRITIDGRSCELQAGRGAHELRSDGRVLATCTPARATTPWSVTLGSETLVLRPASRGKRELTLEKDEQELGRLWSSGSIRTTYTAELPPDLDPPTQVFLLWAARTEWARRAATTAAVGSVGTIGS